MIDEITARVDIRIEIDSADDGFNGIGKDGIPAPAPAFSVLANGKVRATSANPTPHTVPIVSAGIFPTSEKRPEIQLRNPPIFDRGSGPEVDLR